MSRPARMATTAENSKIHFAPKETTGCPLIRRRRPDVSVFEFYTIYVGKTIANASPGQIYSTNGIGFIMNVNYFITNPNPRLRSILDIPETAPQFISKKNLTLSFRIPFFFIVL